MPHLCPGGTWHITAPRILGQCCWKRLGVPNVHRLADFRCPSEALGRLQQSEDGCCANGGAHVAVLVLGQVGRAQEGVDGGAGHPGQRGGGVDGDAAPGLPQAAALAPLLLLPPPLGLPLQARSGLAGRL